MPKPKWFPLFPQREILSPVALGKFSRKPGFDIPIPMFPSFLTTNAFDLLPALSPLPIINRGVVPDIVVWELTIVSFHCPITVDAYPFDWVDTPIAVELNPFAIDPLPSEVVFVPRAWVELPSEVDCDPEARV